MDRHSQPKPSKGVMQKLGEYKNLVLVAGGLASSFSADASVTPSTGHDFDTDFATDYTPATGVDSFCGFVSHDFTYNGMGFKCDLSDGSVRSTTDGITFSENLMDGFVTAEPTFDTSLVDIFSYDGKVDQLMLMDGQTDIYVFEGLGNTGVVTNSFKLQSYGSNFNGSGDIDSIDNGDGTFTTTYYAVDTNSSRDPVHGVIATDSASPTDFYEYNSLDDIYAFKVKTAINQGAFVNQDGSDSIYWITDLSAGSGNATDTGVDGYVNSMHTADETKSYPIITYKNYDTDALEYMYDSSSPYTPDTDGDGYTDDVDAFPTDSAEWTDTDSDGVGDNSDAFPTNPDESADTDTDGVGDVEDCEPNNPEVYPGKAATSTDDGLDENCDLADAPVISSLEVSPAATVELGETLTFNATAEDEDTFSTNLSFGWKIYDSSRAMITSWASSGSSTTYTPEAVGNYSIEVIVTDEDGNSSTRTEAFVVSPKVVSLADVEEGVLDENTSYSGVDGSGQLEIDGHVSYEDIDGDGDLDIVIHDANSWLGATDMDFDYYSYPGEIAGYASDFDGELGTGGDFATFRGAYRYADDPSDALYVLSMGNSGFNVHGSYTDSEDNLELDHTFNGPFEEYLGDVVDAPDETDADGDTDTDTDADGDADTDTDTDADGDSDADGDTDADSDADNLDDTGTPNNVGCQSCSVADLNGNPLDNPWSFALGALTVAGTTLRRRK